MINGDEGDELHALREEVFLLRTHLHRMYELCTVGANPGAFDNGVTDSTGSIDEGDVIAGRIIDDVEKILGIGRYGY